MFLQSALSLKICPVSNNFFFSLYPEMTTMTGPESYHRGTSTKSQQYLTLALFILEDALSVWTNLGKHLLLVWLFVSSIKTGTRRIIRLDKLFSVVCRSRRTTEDNSSRRIMRLVPVFILETNYQTSNKCLSKFIKTDNASSSIKTAINRRDG